MGGWPTLTGCLATVRSVCEDLRNLCTKACKTSMMIVMEHM